ncbi:MAG: VIT domain-containing protein [Actinomycetota bacterium]
MNGRFALALTAAVFFAGFSIFFPPGDVSAGSSGNLASQLQIVGKDGQPAGFVPLRHTTVKTEISGFVARTEVTQEFENVLADPVEAIYVFPLPENGAVDGMTMKVGDREIQAIIKERDEARKIYEAARNAGHTAALLDQERPNIFTQSVANIPPNSKVEVKLYVLELLKYEAGTYEFAFPTVVGPRYIPGSPTAGSSKRGTMPDTSEVPDASKISPPVAGVHTGAAHAGHDISFGVNLKAGVPISDVESTSHKIFADRTGADSFHITLADETVLPNKDFILKYKVAGVGIDDAVLQHSDASGGYFSLILQPPELVSDEVAVPRQLIFVLDTSGSMFGFPLEMAKKTILRALDNLRTDETFNLITFAGATRVLFPEPVPATRENIATAKKVLAGTYGGGGTEMMTAIRTALGDDAGADKPMEGDPIRVVCFMTDGYVGNDAAIIAEVKKHPDARVFAFGIGTAVNRFLLTKMSEEGHGDVEFVTDPKEAGPAADRFYERVHTPVLTNISIDWNGLPVTDIYPRQAPDLFSAKPIVITGRFTGHPAGNIVVKGMQGTGEFGRVIPVNFSEPDPDNAALEKIWARDKVDDLMSQDWQGIQYGNSKYKADIIKVGLEHSLATQYTSFVAVETRTVVQDGKPVRIEVPVELPERVSPLAVPEAQSQSGMAGGIGIGTSYKAMTRSGLNAYATSAAPPPPPAPNFISTETIEVTSTSPMVDKDHAQVTTKFDGTLLHGPVAKAASGGGGSTHKLKRQGWQLQQKLSAPLLAIYDCAVSRGAGISGSGCTLKPGPVKIRVELAATSSEIAQKLARAGFRLETGKGTTQLTGSILPTRLKQLAMIAEVKSVSLAQ